MEEIRRVARQRRLSVGEWVRQALRAARHQEPVVEAHRKLAAIREAAQYSFPTADIPEMLAEVERGYQE
jgi:hypothetical protein